MKKKPTRKRKTETEEQKVRKLLAHLKKWRACEDVIKDIQNNRKTLEEIRRMAEREHYIFWLWSRLPKAFLKAQVKKMPWIDKVECVDCRKQLQKAYFSESFCQPALDRVLSHIKAIPTKVIYDQFMKSKLWKD